MDRSGITDETVIGYVPWPGGVAKALTIKVSARDLHPWARTALEAGLAGDDLQILESVWMTMSATRNALDAWSTNHRVHAKGWEREIISDLDDKIRKLYHVMAARGQGTRGSR